MVNVLKRGLLLAVGLGMVALLVGGLAGFVNASGASSETAAAGASASWFLALALLLPLALWALASTFLDQDRPVYAELGNSLAIFIIAAILGALFAPLGFVTAAMDLAVLANSRFQPAAYNLALQGQMNPATMGIVLGASLIAAVFIAWWATRRATH